MTPPISTGRIKKNHYEKEAWAEGQYVIGIDEVGRGCLAGPVVTAAVMLHINKKSPILRDSKVLSRQELIKGASWTVKNSWYTYGFSSNQLIDHRNIYQATLTAMKRSVLNLLAQAPHRPYAILVDAMPLNLSDTNYHTIPIHAFVKGETYSCSIAAASIIAKVKRDQLMETMATIIPGYEFQHHKGYGTQRHQKALSALGKTIIHRTTFLEKFDAIEEANEQQTSLC